MASSKKISSALVSVFSKDGIEPVLRKLDALGITLISTGGTQSYIESLGLSAVSVESITDYPSIFGGRVKTLHPKVFGGILHRRDHEGDLKEKEQFGIPAIDLVIVDLYPFEETVGAGKQEDEIIEKIDIGGISLIRAAAKNFGDTLIVSSREDYAPLLELLEKKSGSTDLEDRKSFATRAFATSSHYDGQINAYFEGRALAGKEMRKTLRYGENPHQQAVFSGDLDALFDILNGKELSYNNLVDVDAAIRLVAEFDAPTVAVIKHTNSCGLATRETIAEAYEAAFACDTTSAFGGVIASNRTIDLAAANAMSTLFFEVLVAPGFEPEALELLRQKKNRIIIRQKQSLDLRKNSKTLLNGTISQDQDASAEGPESFRTVTFKAPGAEELEDLAFAVKAVKHLKSNGIALVKKRQLIGMGCGQTSRIDALEHAIRKSKEFGFDLHGAVMASDAFFPFPDCVQIAHKAGITAIAQPGGSIKDEASIEAANANGQAMVLTGVRHFRH